jgi:hypothetical protein
VNQTLQQLHYRKLKRSARGLVRRYLAKMTGLSRAQVTRLLGLYLRGEKVKPKPYRRYRFPRRYTPEDTVLLPVVDEAHDTLSGPATERILQGAHGDFGNLPNQRLAELSVAQLYRLRKPRLSSAAGDLSTDAAHQGQKGGPVTIASLPSPGSSSDEKMLRFKNPAGPKPVRFSHGDFGLVIQPLHYTAGKRL